MSGGGFGASGALHGQALALHRAGRFAEAEQAYRQHLAQAPADAAATHGLCVLLLQTGRESEAEQRLTGLLRVANVAPAWLLLAQLRRRQGRIDDALAALASARAAGLADPAVDTLHGTLLAAAGDDAGAETRLLAALRRQPASAEAWHVLGQVRFRSGRWAEAQAAYLEAASRTPNDPAVQYNLGLAAESGGDLETALAAFSAAVRLAPQRVDALGRLAAVQARLFDTTGEATTVAALDRQLQTGPTGDTIEPFLLTFLPLSPTARSHGLARYEANLRAAVRGRPPLACKPRTTAPIRIGYLSPDLGHHAVGGLMRDVFAAHDRSRVAVHAYAQRQHTGDTADTIRAGCDVYRDVSGLDPGRTAQAIADDGIDVLIDLGGYTRGADGRVLALRPAPRQVAYLGFIHDHGAEWIDALLLDAHVAPDPATFSHRVLHMPGTLLPGSRTGVAPAPDRAAFDLPDDRPVFASFNTSYKLDAAVVAAWLAIHHAAPQVLFLLVLPEATRPRVLAAWQAGGGDVTALRFAGPLAPSEHARRAASCDLLLDTFRYHAGATAIASAAAGLPVLCVPGELPLARMSAGVNRFLGLDTLVCATASDYVARAVALAHDRAQLQALRATVLQQAMAVGLFDPRRTAAGIEDALFDLG